MEALSYEEKVPPIFELGFLNNDSVNYPKDHIKAYCKTSKTYLGPVHMYMN